MAKADNNKESGAEKAPVLTEGKGVEITPELVAELQAKNSELEKSNQEKDTKIAEWDSLITEQLGLINEGIEKEEKDAVVIAELKEIVANKDAFIAEDQKLIEAQKEEIVQLLKDQAELNKLIPDGGVTDNHGLQIRDNEDLVVIRFLLSPAGKFKLPYNVGQEVALHKEVAAEIVESAYAEYV